MKKQLPKRNELNINHTWAMTNLFETEEKYLKAFDEVTNLIDEFESTYSGKLATSEVINEALDAYQVIQGNLSRLGAYSSLQTSTDSLSEENQMRHGKAMMRFQQFSKKLTFLSNELKQVDNETLLKAAKASNSNGYYIKELIEDKVHTLSPEVEKALVSLSPVLSVPYQNYNRFKLADMKFNDFEADGNIYPNSFTLFENEYEYEIDTKIRRQAYESFYEKLAEYQHGFASNYQAHVQKE